MDIAKCSFAKCSSRRSWKTWTECLACLQRKSCVSHWTGDLVSRHACFIEVIANKMRQFTAITGQSFMSVFYQKHSHFTGKDDCIVSFWKTLNKLLNSVWPYDIFLNHAESSQFFGSARIHGEQKKHRKMGPKELHRWNALSCKSERSSLKLVAQ